MLKENDRAPDFLLRGSDGKEHSLTEFKGRRVVLYFYPKDDTPGCTIEAKCFTKSKGDIRALGAEVIGISADNLDSHERFRSKYSLDVLLLSDPEKGVIKAYDAYGDKGIFGFGILRKTFIIGRDGRIMKIFARVHPDGHDKEVIDFLNDSS